ncbi:unnamed protein product [Ixodes hexagonus]
MDLTQQPCQAFHAYVCGRYKETQIDPLSKLVAKNLSSRIQAEFLKIKSTSDNESAKEKAAAFLGGCLSSSEDAQKKESSNTLVRFLKQNSLLFEVAGARNIDLLDQTFRFLLEYNLRLFFWLFVEPWPRRGEAVRYIHLVTSDKSWIDMRDRSADKNRYEELVKQVLLAASVPEDDQFAAIVQNIISMEEKVMNIRNQSFENASYTLSLAAEWGSALKTHSKGVLDEGYILNLKSNIPAFLNAVSAELDANESALYLTWKVAGHLASVAGLVTDDHWERRQEFCFGETHTLFKNAVVAPYLFHAVDQATVTEVRRMIDLVAQELQVSIRYSNWPEPDIRSRLQEKIAAAKWKLGYSMGLNYWGGVDRFYSDYPVPVGPFLETYLDTSRAYALQQLTLQPHWSADFANVIIDSEEPTVFYGGPNTVTVPAAAMLSPFFNVRERAALNYGALGSIVTRHLMQAFNDDNRVDDGKGSPIDWSESELSRFREHWNCHQNLHPGPSYEDAEPAVSIGAHALFRAYKVAAAGQFAPAVPEGLSSDQLFFVSRCYAYCGDKSLDAPHECDVLAQDSVEFAKVFGCPPGSPMNPEKKCDAW